MNPFNLEQAKAGKPVVTRDGRQVRIISFDLKGNNYHIVAFIEMPSGYEECATFTNEGKQLAFDSGSGWDLFMAKETKRGWINIYPEHFFCGCSRVSEPYGSKEAADRNADQMVRLDCIEIEWKE